MRRTARLCLSLLPPLLRVRHPVPGGGPPTGQGPATPLWGKTVEPRPHVIHATGEVRGKWWAALRQPGMLMHGYWEVTSACALS